MIYYWKLNKFVASAKIIMFGLIRKVSVILVIKIARIALRILYVNLVSHLRNR